MLASPGLGSTARPYTDVYGAESHREEAWRVTPGGHGSLLADRPNGLVNRVAVLHVSPTLCSTERRRTVYGVRPPNPSMCTERPSGAGEQALARTGVRTGSFAPVAVRTERPAFSGTILRLRTRTNTSGGDDSSVVRPPALIWRPAVRRFLRVPFGVYHVNNDRETNGTTVARAVLEWTGRIRTS